MILDIPEGGYGIYKPGRAVVRPDRMLRIHGYRDASKVRPIIVSTADEIAERSMEIMTPEVHYRRVRIEELRDGELELDGGIVFHNPAFSKFMGDATEVAVVILTVGEPLDDEVKAVMEEFDPLRALFLETAGWLGIEWTTREFRGYLRDTAAREGYRVSFRMGPGYSYKVNGDETMWPLDEQRQLFSAFGDIKLPVRLFENSCAMMPKMSRSGIYGLAPVD